MELYLLDGDLSRLTGPIDEVRSLIWTERYFSCGEFSMELPLSYCGAAAKARFVEMRGKRSVGRAEKLYYEEAQGILRISGRMAESILSDRIIKRGTYVSGTLHAAVEKVLSENAVGSGAGERMIKHLRLGSMLPLTDTHGVPLQYEAHLNGKALDEWLYTALSAAGASYRISLNAAGDALLFSIDRGIDRTQNQTVNSFAIFSAEFSSISDLKFTCDEASYKNFAYIAGEGEGSARVVAELDLREDAGEPLRELYIDARDIRSDDGTVKMSEASYRNALLARGRERMLSHQKISCTEGMTARAADTSPGTMRAGIDFALGDICDVVCPQLGMRFCERVTALTTVNEGAGSCTYAQFGSTYPALRTVLQRAT